MKSLLVCESWILTFVALGLLFSLVLWKLAVVMKNYAVGVIRKGALPLCEITCKRLHPFQGPNPIGWHCWNAWSAARFVHWPGFWAQNSCCALFIKKLPVIVIDPKRWKKYVCTYLVKCGLFCSGCWVWILCTHIYIYIHMYSGVLLAQTLIPRKVG